MHVILAVADDSWQTVALQLAPRPRNRKVITASVIPPLANGSAGLYANHLFTLALNARLQSFNLLCTTAPPKQRAEQSLLTYLMRSVCTPAEPCGWN